MIESSFICPSAWESDPFQDFNGSLPDIHSLFDLNEDFPDTGSGDLSPYSNDFSSNSDDLILSELNLDVTEEFVAEILQESNNAGFSDLDWLSLKDSPKKSPPSSTNTDSTHSSNSRDRTSSEHLESSKKWSDMSETEQLETLHALSEIVTFHMCIREQMEIIKIIDPEAVISPEDKEFALDSTYLDDFKLERIKDFLKGQTELKKPPKSKSTFSPIKSSKKVHSSSKLLSRKSDTLPYSKTKRKQKKQETVLKFDPTADEHLKLKRRKQTRKERKSGFFVYEKKMKLVNPQDDEDVNILE